jgi:hypothetical protein
MLPLNISILIAELVKGDIYIGRTPRLRRINVDLAIQRAIHAVP